MKIIFTRHFVSDKSKLPDCEKVMVYNMSNKTDIDVIIGGKVYTLSGYESESYLQKVASYINNKMNECGKSEVFRKLPLDKKNILLNLNIADDYFKVKQKISAMEEEWTSIEKEIYELRHKLVNAEIKLESANEKFTKMQEEKTEQAKKIIELETKLKSIT